MSALEISFPIPCIIRKMRGDSLSSASYVVLCAVADASSQVSLLLYAIRADRNRPRSTLPFDLHLLVIFTVSHVATRFVEDIWFEFRDQRGSEGTNSKRGTRTNRKRAFRSDSRDQLLFRSLSSFSFNHPSSEATNATTAKDTILGSKNPSTTFLRRVSR